ncbi:lysophospholipid acyltransferase family protein [bacterium]|nr:lysophospholipid acyltransferase family protein [bacterium]
MALLRKRTSLPTRLLVWSIPKLFFGCSHLLFRSCRITYLGKEHEDEFLRRGEPICFAGLHQGMLYLPFHFRDRDGVVMVSASRDGDLISRTMGMFGLRSARGSTRHGGAEALQAMIREVNDARCSAGVIVDGPRGPAGIAKRGAILLARATGLPIVPGTWWATPHLEFGSWDRTIVPLPFARMVFAFEPALHVAPDADDAEVEALRIELTARLERARATALAACA